MKGGKERSPLERRGMTRRKRWREERKGKREGGGSEVFITSSGKDTSDAIVSGESNPCAESLPLLNENIPISSDGTH